MRKREQTGSLSVHAIAGTYIVLLGMDVSTDAAKGLLGFTITRETPGIQRKKKILGSGRYFASVHPDPQGVLSNQAPIQAFLWGDYEAEPGTTYTYRIVAQYGVPGNLQAGEQVAIRITTESREDSVHSIYFNRGVAGSQAYSRHFDKHRRWYLVDRFGKVEAQALIRPDTVPNREAYKWLSRGLEEAMLSFIAQASGPGYSLRAAVYEFTYPPVIQAFVDALERGVDVKIVHHAKRQRTFVFKTQNNPMDGSTNWMVNTTTTWDAGHPPPQTYKNKYIVIQEVKDDICQAADTAVAGIGLKDEVHLGAFQQWMIERTETTISHNKFIVLLKDGKPIQVWTGSTNFTPGGIFGQSNVGHVIRDETVAAHYLAYWDKLSQDPMKAEIVAWTAEQTPNLDNLPPSNSITPIFSPRPNLDMLHWYAARIGAANRSVFFTAAFSIDESFMQQLVQEKPRAAGEAYQRYIILESTKGLLEEKVKLLQPIKQNRIAWGDVLKERRGEVDEALLETLTGLNENVQYVHTKYLLIDPLSDDPLVMTGSANFSRASTTDNDENLLIIRGDTRVADIFLGEFMRLFRHFEIRNRLNRLSDEEFDKAQRLAEDDSWLTAYFIEGTAEQQERILFR